MREEGDEILERHENVAAALQKRVEEAYFHLAEWAKNETGKDKLCLAGGVALNSVANGKLLKSELYDDVYIPPTAGDDGTSLGGALYYHHCELNNDERYSITPSMGPEYDDEDIVSALDRFNLEYRKSENVCEKAAQYLANDKIVGWFQGRMEMGPRVLGNRSILGNPQQDEVKRVLNSRVKFREAFRPFAPSILLEDVDEWFDYDDPSPYMILVYDVLPEKREQVPGITHVDGTGRLQTVSEEDNERYHRLISAFKERTGVPIVVNTSFNIKGEPIVNTPIDAIRCFLGNGIDYLVMGDYVVDKENLA
jgi:carbamoyltransferase